jgi:hypothetical protein
MCVRFKSPKKSSKSYLSETSQQPSAIGEQPNERQLSVRGFQLIPDAVSPLLMADG